MMSDRIESPAISACPAHSIAFGRCRQKVSGFLSLTISIPEIRSPRPEAASLASWWKQVALGHQHEARSVGQRGEGFLRPSNNSTGWAWSALPASRIWRMTACRHIVAAQLQRGFDH
jgi:hypothetical protein